MSPGSTRKMLTLNDFKRTNDVANMDHKNLDFLKYLMSKWTEIHEEYDVFRYKIDKLQEKIVSGYLLQLNPERSNNRRQPEHIDSICQPFDKDKFNFTKASPKEVLFTFKNDVHDPDVHSVLVNVSPISRYHSLLCPSVYKCLPQIVTKESLELAMNIMFCGDRSLRIGFNSLCGLASVNHLHYHLFVDKNVLPVENSKCDHIKGPLYCLSKDYPVPAFCFQVPGEKYVMEMSRDIFKLLEHFLKNSIAHNIFMTKADSISGEDEVLRVFVWPRKSSAGVKQLGAFNVAVLELSGWFPVYNADDFESLQRVDLESELIKWKIDNFEDLCKEIKELY